MRRSLVLGFLLVAFASGRAHAQLPVQISVNGGLAVPMSNEKDLYENGVHAGVAVKLPAVPFRFEAAYDKMGATSTNEDIKLLSGGVSLGIPLTPPLVPVGAYLIAGVGIYRTEAETTSTNAGLTGGLGVRAGVPGLSVFAEGRGVAVLSEVSAITYLTASVGIRF